MTNDNKNKPKKMNPESESVAKSDKKNEYYYRLTGANKKLKDEGFAILTSMSPEERENLGNKSNTLHFVTLLGLASKPSTKTKYRDGQRYYDKEPQPIGVTLYSDIDIDFPELKDITKDKISGIDLEKDFSYRTVKAGDHFHLTYYEFMYLIIRPEYAGQCEAMGVPDGLRLSVKMTAYEKDKAKLPTPTLNFDKDLGSIRTYIINIDYKTQQGKWVVRSGLERFEPFLKSKNKKRKLNAYGIKKIAIALQEQLALENIAEKKSENEKGLVTRGGNILKIMGNERKKKLGNKSAKLHLKNLLVIKQKGNSDFLVDKPVGMTLVSEEEIQVPVIDVLKNNKTGINPTTDISYLTVNAGEHFSISNYEFMYLIVRDEYVGFCSFDNDKEGAYFLPNFENYFSGKNKLPYPKLYSSYSYNPEPEKIYQEAEDGSIKIIPQYVEKFGALLR